MGDRFLSGVGPDVMMINDVIDDIPIGFRSTWLSKAFKSLLDND
mgnify:CR=1 FL=1